MTRRVAVTLFVVTLFAVLAVPGGVAATSALVDVAAVPPDGNIDTPVFDRLQAVTTASSVSRIDTDDVLGQPTREAIYSVLQESPGGNLLGLAAAVGVTKSTVRYHTDVLRTAGLIEATEVAGALRFAPADTDVELAASLRAEATGAVLDAVAAHEPASVTTVAETTDRAPSTVSHHLSTLEDHGLVERERAGESVLTTLAPDTRMKMNTLVPTPVDD